MRADKTQADKLAREIQLYLNSRLFKEGAVSEETHRRAKEYILKRTGRAGHGSVCDPQ